MKVFVTRELHPFTAGGIGRVVGNILAGLDDRARSGTAVVVLGTGIAREAFEAAYPGVTFEEASHRTYELNPPDGTHFAPSWAYSNSILAWESVLAMQALRRLEAAHGPLEFIEFPDWGGLAFSTTQEKLLGRSFTQATIAVRLHTTDSVLADNESRHVDLVALCLHDIERKALADCDLVIGQVPEVAERMRLFYGFSEADWASRLVIHPPPVVIDTRPPAIRSVGLGPKSPIIFSSKIQSVKRPEVFLEGALAFLDEAPGYEGNIMFLAHAFDTSYLARIKEMIPRRHAARVVFLGGVQGAPRESIIAESVCVFPTSWESFCLAAYEASLLGAVCVVNRRNPAFEGSHTWIEGENCHGFDGSPAGLSRALHEAFRVGGGLGIVRAPAAPLPWERAAALSQAPATAQEAPAATIVLRTEGSGGRLLAAVERTMAIRWRNLRVVVLENGEGDPLVGAALDYIEALDDPEVLVLRAGCASLESRYAKAITLGDPRFIVLCDAASVFSTRFVEDALSAMAADSQISMATGQQSMTNGELDRAHQGDGTFEDYRIVHGEARASVFYENRASGPMMVLRASLATKLPCMAEGRASDVWRAMLDATAQGIKCVVASEVVVVKDLGHHEARGMKDPRGGYHDLLAGRSFRFGNATVPLYALEVGAQLKTVGGGDAASLEAELAELRSSEAVRVALGVARRLERLAPWLLRILRSLAGPVLRR